MYLDSDESKYCCIDFYLENKSDDAAYTVFGNYGSVNGIQCDTGWGMSASANKIQTDTICFDEDITNTSKVSEIYNVSE